MVKSLKVLFFPIDAVGHVNSGIGIAEVLIASGHKPIFIISDKWKGKLIKYDIEEHVLTLTTQEEEVSDSDAAQYWVDLMRNANAFTGLSPLKRMINMRKYLLKYEMLRLQELDPILEQTIRHLKPDIILTDQFLTVPAIVNSKIPWVFWCSPNPLVFLDDESTPPGCSGLSSTAPKQEWQEFRDAVSEASHENWKYWNQFCLSKGLKPLEDNKFLSFSEYLNIYGYPLELDYIDIRPLPPNWYRFDNLKRTENFTDFEVPSDLCERPGKLIYFSLGSMGGADIELMKRLVAILSKSPNKFIVSKGPLHYRYELCDNMWGQQSVPQIQVLSSVDLVVTHGGNNTVTETLFYGKPMLVLPLFGDQHDNAQRIVEKGLGLKLNPHKCTEEELLNAIEKLLNDTELNERLQNISKRIQSDNSIGKLSQIIENLVK